MIRAPGTRAIAVIEAAQRDLADVVEVRNSGAMSVTTAQGDKDQEQGQLTLPDRWS